VVEAVRRSTTLPIDVHLMIANPDQFVEAFAKAGADYIAVQVETTVHLHRSIHLIKSFGKKAGAVLNPATPLSSLEWMMPDLDLVVVMSVNPGFGGQTFIPHTLDKIRALRKMIDAHHYKALIQIDGGVNNKSVADIVSAGADVLVAGSAIFGSSDYERSIMQLKTG
jgi:ribulose-phosphate 3-epimerase